MAKRHNLYASLLSVCGDSSKLGIDIDYLARRQAAVEMKLHVAGARTLRNDLSMRLPVSTRASPGWSRNTLRRSERQKNRLGSAWRSIRPPLNLPPEGNLGGHAWAGNRVEQDDDIRGRLDHAFGF